MFFLVVQSATETRILEKEKEWNEPRAPEAFCLETAPRWLWCRKSGAGSCHRGSFTAWKDGDCVQEAGSECARQSSGEGRGRRAQESALGTFESRSVYLT